VIVDSGSFDFAAQPERFPGFNTPDESYHGLVYARDLGVGSPLGANLAFILKARAEGQRDLGFALAPHSAFLIAQGIETLSLRIERHVDNALAVATWLEGRDDVASVRYSGLTSSPYYERHRKYCPRGAGSILTFDLAGGREAGAAFIDALSLFSNLANIGDVRSLAIHPATTTHPPLDDAPGGHHRAPPAPHGGPARPDPDAPGHLRRPRPGDLRPRDHHRRHPGRPERPGSGTAPHPRLPPADH